MVHVSMVLFHMYAILESIINNDSLEITFFVFNKSKVISFHLSPFLSISNDYVKNSNNSKSETKKLSQLNKKHQTSQFS